MKNLLNRELFNKLFENKREAEKMFVTTGKITSDEWKLWLEMSSELYKYLPYAIKNWIADDRRLPIETAQSIIYDFDFFKQRNQVSNADINTYAWRNLELYVKDLKDVYLEKQQAKKVVSEGAEKVYEDSTVVLMKILSMEASIKYGAGATWCISAKDEDLNAFHGYHQNQLDTFYFLINKQTDKLVQDLYDRFDQIESERHAKIGSRAGYRPLDKNEPHTMTADNNTEAKLAIQVNIKGGITVWNTMDNSTKDIDGMLSKWGYSNLKKYLVPRELRILDFVKGDYELDDNGRLNVTGNVEIKQNMDELNVEFGIVTGNFSAKSIKLKSLKGFPIQVTGNLDISRNDLVDLEGCTPIVGGNFIANNNDLKTTKGFPQSVGGNVELQDNYIIELFDMPDTLDKDLNIFNNDITNFKGFPRKIKTCNVSHNKIKSLEGLPEELEKLDLYDTDMSDELIAQIKRALPNTILKTD
jgi:hypothetical protein